MMDELEKWVLKLEAQLPATRKLLGELRAQRLAEE